MNHALDNLGGELNLMRHRKTELEGEIRNLTEAIAKSSYQSASVMADVAEHEGELSEITDRLLEARPDSVRGRVDVIRNFALSRLSDLCGPLTADVADTLVLKAKLSKHVQAITLEPGGSWRLIARGSWDSLGDGAMGVCRGRELHPTRRIDFVLEVAA